MSVNTWQVRDRVFGYDFGSEDHHDRDSDRETRRYPHFGKKPLRVDKINKIKNNKLLFLLAEHFIRLYSVY